MRDDVGEVNMLLPSRPPMRGGRLCDAPSGIAARLSNLQPVAVDEALADESSACVDTSNSTDRRAIDQGRGDADRSCMLDRPHGAMPESTSATLDGDSVLQELADRLAELQMQQAQIEQLLSHVRRR